MKIAPSLPDPVDVGRFANHQAAMVDTRLHPADVVAHDEKNVRFLRTARGALLSGGRPLGDAHDIRGCLRVPGFRLRL